MGHGRFKLILALALLAITAAVYAPVVRHGFISYDDPDYISFNPHVLQGLSLSGVRWAFSHGYAANYFPLTWITLMAQADAFGAHPAGYHAADVVTHACNAVLVMLVLAEMTGCLGRSAVVAALFAVHPMHVESVAWAAEWKDVLSTLLVLAAMWAYVRYVRRPAAWRYGLVLLLYALCLLAKATYVTLPVLLLVLDCWPLRRPLRGKLVPEKLPLAVAAAGACAAALWAQRLGHAVAASAALPLRRRLAHAPLAYLAYLRKLVLPNDLAVFYPYPPVEPKVWCFVAAGVLVALTVVLWLLRRRRPYLIVGWMWFVGTLLPMIGIVQVGAQAMADRYSYFPSIGLMLAVVWLAAEAVQRSPVGQRVAVGVAVVWVVLLGILARRQIDTWRDDETLFSHDLAVVGDNWLANFELANVDLNNGDAETAAVEYNQMIQLRPGDPRGYNGLGNCLMRGDPAAAARCYAMAVALQPDAALYHVNLAASLAAMGRYSDALAEVRTARGLDPGSTNARAAEEDLLRRQAAAAAAGR